MADGPWFMDKSQGGDLQRRECDCWCCGPLRLVTMCPFPFCFCPSSEHDMLVRFTVEGTEPDVGTMQAATIMEGGEVEDR